MRGFTKRLETTGKVWNGRVGGSASVIDKSEFVVYL